MGVTTVDAMVIACLRSLETQSVEEVVERYPGNRPAEKITAFVVALLSRKEFYGEEDFFALRKVHAYTRSDLKLLLNAEQRTRLFELCLESGLGDSTYKGVVQFTVFELNTFAYLEESLRIIPYKYHTEEIYLALVALFRGIHEQSTPYRRLAIIRKMAENLGVVEKGGDPGPFESLHKIFREGMGSSERYTELLLLADLCEVLRSGSLST